MTSAVAPVGSESGGPKKTRRLAAGVLIGGGIVILASCAGTAAICGGGAFWFYNDQFPDVYMDYSDLTFLSTNSGSTFTEGHRQANPIVKRKGMPKVYVQIYGKRVGLLADLTPEEAKLWGHPLTGDGWLGESRQEGSEMFESSSTLEFQDGRLVALRFSKRDDQLHGIMFSARPEGPYLGFPMSQTQLREVFGKPDRFERKMPISWHPPN